MTPQIEIRGLVLALDLAGTAVFALSGAAVGVKLGLMSLGSASLRLSRETPAACCAIFSSA
jgi:hypothetical protein